MNSRAPLFEGLSRGVLSRSFPMQLLATLAKYNRQRGVITWRYCEGADGSFFSIRNDGRKYPYTSKDEMRTGYSHMKNVMGFAPVDLLAV